MNFPFLCNSWKCKTWNYPEEQWCVRCGAPVEAMMRRGRGESWNESSYHSEAPYNNTEYYDDPRGEEGKKQDEYRRREGGGSPKEEKQDNVDEFGRASKPPPKPREWPPCFDTNGQDFVFDVRSAMFYEAESDFFYDPKSKLYYGNKQKAYYRHVAGQRPPFEQVQKVEANTTVEPVVLNTQPAKDNNSKASTTQKKTITISLKTKSLPKSKTKSEDKNQVPCVPAPLLKKHEADMEKWSERQVEKKQQQSQPEESKQQQVAKTAKGEPICLLCKRKFPNLEKLQYHERVSKLHKDNLAKAAVAAEKQQEYVDRAAQRRIMYGPESSSGATRTPTTTTVETTTSVEEKQQQPVRPQDNLGESNIGNQMLQKLGWKDGESLGRGNGGSSSSKVVQDWERIESIAEQGGKSSQTSAGIGLHR